MAAASIQRYCSSYSYLPVSLPAYVPASSFLIMASPCELVTLSMDADVTLAVVILLLLLPLYPSMRESVYVTQKSK